MKNFFIISISLLTVIQLYSKRNSLEQSVTIHSDMSFKKYKYSLHVDTIFKKDSAFLIYKFSFLRDVIKYKVSYNRKNKDFSFYYPELYDTTKLFFNGHLIPNLNTAFYPSMHDFFTGFDSIVIINKGDETFYLLFGDPFFCNGHNCTGKSVLIIDKNENGFSYCLEITTSYCSEKMILNKIKHHLEVYGTFSIPNINDCETDLKIRKWISIDSIDQVVIQKNK